MVILIISPSPNSFSIIFILKNNLNRVINADFNGIWTWTFDSEGKHADHQSTTKAMTK